MAYDQLEPFGPWREDLRAGIIASTVAAAAGAKGVKPADYMPDFEGNRGRQSVAQMKDIARAFSKAFIAHQQKRAGE